MRKPLTVAGEHSVPASSASNDLLDQVRHSGVAGQVQQLEGDLAGGGDAVSALISPAEMMTAISKPLSGLGWLHVGELASCVNVLSQCMSGR